MWADELNGREDATTILAAIAVSMVPVVDDRLTD